MPERWSTDRELDVATVGRVLRGQFSHMPVATLEYLGSGWDYDAYLVDGAVVVRFPRRAEVADRLEREEAILDFVANALGGAVRVPRVSLRGVSDQHFPYRFFGHDVLPGVRADDPSVVPSSGLADEIGDALTGIHGVSPVAAAAAGIEPEVELCRERLEETEAVVAGVAGVRVLVPEALTWLERGRAAPAEYSGEARFIHNDLCPDHLIVAADTGCLVGVIDWSDAAVGDPVLDFVGLVQWKGWAFTEAVLRRYAGAVDGGFLERLDFLARVLGLKWLANAIERDGDVEKHTLWVRNAFSSPITEA